MSIYAGRLRKWSLVLSIWTLVGVFFSSQAYLMQQPADSSAESVGSSWVELLRQNLTEFYIWALVAPLIFHLGRRFPIVQHRWRMNLPIHMLACLAIAILELGVSTVISAWMRSEAPTPAWSMSSQRFLFLATLQQNILFYWVILGVCWSVDHYRKYHERELRATQLQAQLIQAQLKVLKMQLHPHFLFNTLNAISALIYQDVELADRMIARLGELLRATLENADRQEVPLREELDFIEPYLEIEKARLGPRLCVKSSVDSETMNCLVPNMILQPLVENAIRHGIAPQDKPGCIEISAHRENGLLKLKVCDNGLGFAIGASTKSETGLGLSNTRARLQQLYGSAHHLELSSAPDCGTQVAVSIPFHETSDDRDLMPQVDKNEIANSNRGR
jgi:two-component system, LytTR family, sensor kinase